MTITKQQTGFTLIELAVVVFLIGLLASMGISALKAQMASAAFSATKKKEDVIRDALIAYLAKNKRLPCPAVDTAGGLEGSTPSVRLTTSPPSNCVTYFGLVPYAELGMPKAAALDGWDNFFTYAVSQQWTATLTTTVPINGGSTTNSATTAFNTGNNGTITVNSRMSSTSTSVVAANGTTNSPVGAAVVLISYGANGSGAYTLKGTQNTPPLASSFDEIENAVPTTPLPFTAAVPPPTAPTPGYFQRDYSDNAGAPGGAFDDIVTWLSPNDLISPLVKDGAMQSATGQWADELNNIKNYVTAQLLSCQLPSSLPTQYQTDPWGNNTNYARSFTSSIDSSIVAASSAAAAYTLTTAGQSTPGPSLSTLYFGNPTIQNNCP